MKEIFVAGYWGPRLDSTSFAVDNIINTVEVLKAHEPIFSNFYTPGYSKKQVYSNPFSFTPESIEKLIKKNELKDDYRKIMEGGGARYRFVTQEVEKNSAWIFSGKINSEFQRIRNSCMFEYEAKATGNFNIKMELIKILIECIHTWKPDYICVGIDGFNVEAKCNIWIWRNFMWISKGFTYTLPENFIIYHEDELGTYITSLDHPLKI